MALISQGGMAPTVSGKVGNVVFARNKGGAYIRTFVKPTNPATPLQTAVRSALAGLSAQWSSLSNADRVSFASMANATPFPNRVGLTSILPPLAMFQKINIPRQLAGLPLVTTSPPPPFTLDWDPGAFGISGGAGSTTYTVTFNDAPVDNWTTDPDSAILIYLSPPQSLGINFYKGKFNYLGNIHGAPGMSAPVSPDSFGASIAPVAGSRNFWRAYLSYASGNQGAVSTGFFDT